MKLRVVNSLCLLAAVVALAPSSAAVADGFGTLTGRFVYDGEAPEPAPLFEDVKTIKDIEICKPDGLDQRKYDLLVDPKTKGIANVFVYIYKAPKTIHPSLAKSAEPVIKFDQKNCRFLQHALFVRTDQKVLSLSDDGCAHNTHTYPIRNQPVNFLTAPKDREGTEISFTSRESLPITVKCDIHPWMSSYWLILDHPYAAITKADGSFKIDKLPAGEHEFRLWHERAFYVHKRSAHPIFEEKKLMVTIEAGGTADLGTVKLEPAIFEPAE